MTDEEFDRMLREALLDAAFEEGMESVAELEKRPQKRSRGYLARMKQLCDDPFGQKKGQ